MLGVGLGLVPFIAGCSSDSVGDIVSNGPLAPSSGGQAKVFGELYIGSKVTGANITALDGSGQVLAQATTRQDGQFVLQGQLPNAFRLVATLPGTPGSTFAAEGTLDSAGKAAYVIINVPSTLASDAMQAGLSRADAESRVRTLLRMPANTHLQYNVEESVFSSFSHLAFFSQAASNGGWAAYRQSLDSQLNRPQTASKLLIPSYPLTLAAMTSSLAGLESDVQTVVTAGRATPGLSLAACGASDADPVSASSLISALFSGLTDPVVGAAVNDSYSWIGTKLGYNFGTTKALNEIQSQLVTVQQTLSSIAVSTLNNTYGSLISSTNASYLQPTYNLLTQNYASTLAQANVTNLPQLTPSPGTNLAVLQSTLQSFNTTVAANITDLQNELTSNNSSTNLNTLQQQILYTTQLGTDQLPRFFSAPLRSNAWGAQAPYYYYEGWQNLILYYASEYAQTTGNPPLQVTSAQGQVRLASQSLKQQRQQFPSALPSSQVIVDLEFGLMWYVSVLGDYNSGNTFSDATEAAAAKVVPSSIPGLSYDDWRLPTESECLALQHRGRLTQQSNPPNKSYGNYDNSVNGMNVLGFQNVKTINSDGDIWCNNWAYNAAASPGSDPWSSIANEEFRLTHQDENVDGKSPSTNLPYVLVRSIGPAPLLDPNQGAATSGLQKPYTYPSPYGYPPSLGCNPVQAVEYPGLGIPTAISGLSLAAGQARVDVTYSVAVGGNFTAGVVDAGSSIGFNVNSNTFTSVLGVNNPTINSVNTTIAGTNSSFGALAAPGLALPAFYGSNTIDISNLPGEEGTVVWHNAGNTALPATNVSASMFCLQGSGLNNVTTTASFTQPSSGNVTTQTLLGVFITPRNLILTTGTSNGVNQQFALAAYYSDGTVRAVGSNSTASWSLQPVPASSPSPYPLTGPNPLPAPSLFTIGNGTSLTPGLLFLPSSVAGSTNSPNSFQIRASFGNFTDTVNISAVQ